MGIGASAGGLEAFQRFFRAMPDDSGFAFVIVQHLDPRHPTLLPELLGNLTAMPVEQVRDETPVRPNQVYVIPPNAVLTVEAGILRTRTPEDAGGLRMPIDRMFYSLAQDCGDNAVCMLLSGTGTDGTLGLRSVKEHGGLVIAQSPETAQHDPILRSAINTGLVDYILAPEAMPKKLMEYAAYMRTMRARKHSTLSAEAQDYLARICALLRRRTGHDFSRYKTATLVRRIERRMQVLQIPQVASYVEVLRQEPKEVEALFRDLLIGVTHFFRDPEAFAALAQDVIPKLVAETGQEGTIRVWTPGCATGEEAYSIAILLREALERTDLRLRAQVFAGDIDEDALEVARHGRYPEGVAEHISEERLERFFTKESHTYLVNKEIREMCVFSTHNLIRDPPFSRLDLVVCRNLLIYLEGDLQRHVTNVFHYALRTGGYLFLGPSESLSGPADQFSTVDKKHRIFQRNETVARTPLALPLPDRHRFGRVPPANTRLLHAPTSAQPEVVAGLERILLDHYAPAWVVVDANGHTVYFSPRTGRFLEPAAGVPSTDILEMARKGLRLDLRTAIHKAVKTGEQVIHENITVETERRVQSINLVVRPMVEAGAEPNLFMIVFQELGPAVDRPAATQDTSNAATSDHIVQQLESELRLTKEHLQATVEEVETSNEELKSSNEELLSTNEELHSVNEEMQTSKEELQSVNEELETINLELQKKVEALDRANSDLQNLLQSTQIPTLFVDNQLRIKRFTEAATHVFRLIETDIGRRISDIAPRFEGDVTSDMKQVLRTLVPRDRQVRVTDEGPATYLMRILPYRRLDNMIDGLVITFVDLTQHEEAQEQRARLAAIVESSRDAIVGRTLDGVITTWNEAATRMFGYDEKDAIGKPVALFIPAEQRDAVEQAHTRLYRGESVGPFQTVAVTRDRKGLDVSVAISLLRDGSGQVVGSSGIFRDISDLKRAERALQEEARHKDEFLAVLSHELRNPLAPLRSCLDLLRQPGGAEGAGHCFEIMDRQLRHLTALVNQLMDASRIASGKIQLDFARVDLTDVVRSAIEDQQRVIEEAGLELRLTLPTRPLPVDGDALRLSQVVANLVGNAAKFTPPGGRIAVDVLAEDGRAVVRVTDTGIGMDGDTLQRIFQPFTQAEHAPHRRMGGLGLGLSLVQALVTAHGGSIRATSPGRDQGSSFELELPLKSDLARAQPKPAALGVEGTPRRILIIEDNADAAEGMQMVLERAGHEVAVAHHGTRGLELARSMRPDVLLCDLGLPGMTGYEVAAAISNDTGLRGMRLIALTGYDQPADQARAPATRASSATSRSRWTSRRSAT